MPDNSCDERLKTKAFQSVSFWSAPCTNVVTWDCVDFLLCGSRWRCAKAAKSYGVPKFPDAAIIAVRDSVNTNKDITEFQAVSGMRQICGLPRHEPHKFPGGKNAFREIFSVGRVTCAFAVRSDIGPGNNRRSARYCKGRQRRGRRPRPCGGLGIRPCGRQIAGFGIKRLLSLRQFAARRL